MLRRSTTTFLLVGTLGVAVLATAGAPAAAQDKKVVIGMPGIPPIFTTVQAYVAEKEGLFKKFGANVELRPFDNGTAAARAVLAGDVDMSMSPSPPVINQISNSGANLVAIYGWNNPDWVLASIDPAKAECKDMVGQGVGVDSVGGARSVALRSMLAGCPGVKIEDVQQVALGSNASAAMIAGRLTYGVLHLDDLALIETQGKKLHIMLEMKKTNPTSHYLLMVVRGDKLKENRDAYMRTVAGMVEAAHFMQDPNNADKVADAAAPVGHTKEVSKAALKQFLAVGFWSYEDDGLDQTKLQATIDLMKKIGGIQPGKEVVSYDKLVDRSVWRDAQALMKKP
jgi:ABC-type nitrate/sulfonate/bicarbonate transport system substrate-binding protein